MFIKNVIASGPLRGLCSEATSSPANQSDEVASSPPNRIPTLFLAMTYWLE
jgi:hypothetical protein